MPIANTPKHIVQQIILLATGVPGAENIREQLLQLYEANGNWSEVKPVVDTYMNALLAEHSVPELVQAMAQNALGVTLSDSDTVQLIQNLRARGIDSWSELFVFAIVDVQGQNAAVLDNRADAANIFTDLLGSLNKDSDYDGPQAVAAAREWLRGIDASEASRLAAIEAAENLIPRFVDGNVQGTALDGYIRGATVFIDVNGNGIQDASEPFTTTDTFGNFLFEGDLPTGSIIASGGIDIATNLPFTGMLTAPSGAIVITPLTTLVQQMLARDPGQSLSGIEDLIFTAFGLPKVDLSAFDPIQSGLASGATRAEQIRAVEFQAVTAQIMNALNVGQALLDNLVPANTTANQSMLTALVDALIAAAAAGETVDLSDPAALTALLRAAVVEAGILDANSTAGEIAQVELLSSQAAASLQEINARTAQAATDFANNSTGSAVDALSDIVLLQVVTGQLTTAIATNTTGDFSGIVLAFTGASLTAAFNVADGGDLTSDTPVNDRASPAEPEPQLVAKLLKDSGAFGDNVTNNGTIVVTGIGENRSAEYSLDNGESWSPVGDKNAFTITENGHYKVLVRQVDGDSHVVGTDTSLTLTLFQRSLLLDESFPIFFGEDTTNAGYSLPGYGEDSGRLGYSVSEAGDINGDGFADYLVGVPGYEYGGATILMLGGEQGISGYLELRGAGEDNDSGRAVNLVAESGHSVSGIGDFNGDGYDDFIIGAPGSNNGNGSAFVLFGRPSFDTQYGVSRASLSDLDSEGTDGFRIYGTDEGGNSYMYLGASVSGAGDVNGDGYDDVIVGAPYADDYDGASYVIFGAATGFSNEFNIDDLDGSNGFRIQTPAGGHSAVAVSSAGDVNGDGYADVLVSATDGEGGSHAYLVFGASKFTDTVELGNLSTSGVMISGAFNDYSHFSVSSAGDLNGDGFADVIIGAKATQGADKHSGAAYVVFGTDTWETALDLTNLGARGFKLNGVAWGDETGRSVSSAGDVNGDGYDDLIIGAPGVGGGYGYSRAPSADPGAAYVVFGKASGMGTLNLAELDGHDGFIIEALPTTATRAGFSVSSAGDINGDGYADLLVGAPYASGYSILYERATYVIYGGDFHKEADFPASSFDEHGFLGTAAAERFAGSFGDDSIFGGGGADVIRAGAGNDMIHVPDLDFRLIDGGGGMDALFFTGTGNIDLGDLRGRLTSIEGIDIANGHNNQLTLTARDVLAIADTTALFDGNSTVMAINGDVGDTVVGLATGWHRDTAESVEYVRYTSVDEAVVVLVGVEITTDYQLPPP